MLWEPRDMLVTTSALEQISWGFFSHVPSLSVCKCQEHYSLVCSISGLCKLLLGGTVRL